MLVLLVMIILFLLVFLFYFGHLSKVSKLKVIESYSLISYEELQEEKLKLFTETKWLLPILNDTKNPEQLKASTFTNRDFNYRKKESFNIENTNTTRKNDNDNRAYFMENMSAKQVFEYLRGFSNCSILMPVIKTIYQYNGDEEDFESFKHEDSVKASSKQNFKKVKIEYVNSGWSKSVFSFTPFNSSTKTAVKTVNIDGDSVHLCYNNYINKKIKKISHNYKIYNKLKVNIFDVTSNGYEKGVHAVGKSDFDDFYTSNDNDDIRILEICRFKTLLELMKEVYLMSLLDHDNVIKVRKSSVLT